MSSVQNSNVVRGRLLALLIIPAGVALWVLLWKAGFIASLAAFGIAYGALWLFQFGAKTQPTRSDAYFLIGVIVLGLMAAFVGGMVSDGWSAWSGEFNETAGFFSGAFWSFMLANLFSSELWSYYIMDMVLSFVFAALGVGGLVKDLLSPAGAETPVAVAKN